MKFTSHCPLGSLYIWDWGPRHHWPGWVFSYETIQHVNCGGVSNFQGSVTIGSLDSELILPVNFHVDSLLGDLGSILESKAGGQEFSTAPILQTLTKPVVQGVGNDRFHPRSLFPLAIPEVNGIAPFVFGKESKMVKCMLTPDEALQVYGVSPSVYGRWSPSSKRLVLSMLRVPLKVLVAVATSLILVMGLRVRRGNEENVRQEVHHQEKQHSAEGAAPPAVPAEPAVPVNSAVPVKSVKSVISAVPVKSVKSSAEFSAESADPGELAKPVAPANNLGLPASWRAGERRETLDAAATKVDDAALPIELWNDVLLEDMERETKFSHEEEQALEILQRMVLYPIDLPDKHRVHQEPTAAPKWKGCERCGKIDQKYRS